MSAEFEPARLIAIAFIAGFAIQQLIQILELFLIPLLLREKEIIWRLPSAVFKKGLMHLISFLCGVLIAANLKVDLLVFVEKADVFWLNIVISGLVLGSGTEAANTVIKYFGYLKDAKKYDIRPELEISIVPASATLKVNETAEFKCTVRNSPDANITWRVAELTGGSVLGGRYTAPSIPGDFTVIATSNADDSKSAIAKVSVKP